MAGYDVVALLQRHLSAENAHLMDDTVATLTPDCVFVDVALGRRWEGHAGATEHYRMWWDAFDVQVTGDRLHLAGGGVAVAETHWSGTHVGPFLGIEPSSRPVRFEVAVFIDVRDGLISGERFYWDRAGLLEQLGRSTPPG
jgi:steroid delta-isomerase-like uncharacterized protein